jgi:putative transposase
MARLARLVIPGLPHHVTQRGNRRETVFFNDDDYLAYLDLLKSAVEISGSEIWAWCLMPNHVHMIVTPSHKDGLRQCVANAHRKYAGRINARNKWTGHLWQGRFGSVIMDEAHLYNAFAYICLNPVRARLVARPQDWRWSSVHAHLTEVDDGLTTIGPARKRIDDFAAYLEQCDDDVTFDRLRKSETTGRPIGSVAFLSQLENITGRKLKAGQPGRKKKKDRD